MGVRGRQIRNLSGSSASNQNVNQKLFLREKHKVRLRRFELPRDYLPLGPQPSASANSAIPAESEIKRVLPSDFHKPTLDVLYCRPLCSSVKRSTVCGAPLATGITCVESITWCIRLIETRTPNREILHTRSPTGIHR